LPHLDDGEPRRLLSIGGQPPDLLSAPSSCPFSPRCRHAYDRCRQENPRLSPVAAENDVACWWDIDKMAPRDGR
jgi:peptide/nickel transport system ATP-binding protein/oligopeptide transport system ATP-binding protein